MRGDEVLAGNADFGFVNEGSSRVLEFDVLESRSASGEAPTIVLSATGKELEWTLSMIELTRFAFVLIIPVSFFSCSLRAGLSASSWPA